MTTKKVAVKVAVKKPAPPVSKPALCSLKQKVQTVTDPKLRLFNKVVAKEVRAKVVKQKVKVTKPVQNKLLNKLLNKPKIKEVVEKKLSKFLTDKIPKKMIAITKANNSSLLSMMHKNISSALS